MRQLFRRTMVLLFSFLFKVFYRHKVYGAENLPQTPAIIAPNHLSFFDPPLIGISSSEEIAFLAKDTLFKNRWFAWIIGSLNAYPISGKTSDFSSMKIVLQLLQEQKKVTIFPEGIRSYTGHLADVKRGICMLALRADVPIVPVFIYGTYNIWPRHNKFPKLWGRTACVFGAPIYPAEFQEIDKKEAREKMAIRIKEEIEALRLWYFEHILKEYTQTR